MYRRGLPFTPTVLNLCGNIFPNSYLHQFLLQGMQAKAVVSGVLLRFGIHQAHFRRNIQLLLRENKKDDTLGEMLCPPLMKPLQKRYCDESGKWRFTLQCRVCSSCVRFLRHFIPGVLEINHSFISHWNALQKGSDLGISHGTRTLWTLSWRPL